MDTPKKLTAVDFVMVVQSYFADRCSWADEAHGGLVCNFCGSPIMTKLVSVRLHKADLDRCIEIDSMQPMKIPYCPKCEIPPSSEGCIHVPSPSSFLEWCASDKYVGPLIVRGMREKSLVNAEAESGKAIRLEPQNADQHLTLGEALAEKWDWDGAIAEYREALRLDPNNENAHMNLHWGLMMKGDWDGAIAELRETLRLNPKNDIAHFNLGALLGKKGDWDGAMVEEREALRLNPNNDHAHVNLGVSLENKGDWDGAMAEYREAVRLNPNNDFAHAHLGWALGKKGDWDGAMAELREALRLNPRNEKAHISFGVALMNKGDWEGAISVERFVDFISQLSNSMRSSMSDMTTSAKKAGQSVAPDVEQAKSAVEGQSKAQLADNPYATKTVEPIELEKQAAAKSPLEKLYNRRPDLTGYVFAQGLYLLFYSRFSTDPREGLPIFVARNGDEARAFYILNKKQVRLINTCSISPEQAKSIDCFSAMASGFELPIRLDRVIEHVTADAWDAYNRRDDQWNIACQDALEILAKVQERKPLVFEKYPVLFLTGDQTLAAPGCRYPCMFVAHNKEEFESFYRLNQRQVEDRMVYCLDGVNPDDWPKEGPHTRGWDLWYRNLELPIDIRRVYQHIVDDGERAVKEGDEVWQNGCRVALTILANRK